MRKEIIVDDRPDRSLVAVMEDGQLMEIYFEYAKSCNSIGNLYKGKVENILPGMQAAFVDIGQERNGFLYVDDITDTLKKQAGNEKEIEKIIHSGQELLVQVVKEQSGNKGARLTTNITLPGRYVVLMPTVDYIGISRRIEGEEERQRLLALASEVVPQGMGLIMRTAAEGCEKQALSADIKRLCQLWRRILDRNVKTSPPAIIHKDLELTERIIRDMLTEDVDSVVVSDLETRDRVAAVTASISPALVDKIHFASEGNLLTDYDLPGQLNKALRRKIWLKCGGYLVLDHTEALTVFDVNTGKYVGETNLAATVFQTNLEAAKEIARQVRLRNIGGIIVIDFIDMVTQEERDQVLGVLETELKKDRVKTNILGWTNLGLVEMTRKKFGHQLSDVLQKECPCCQSSGRVIAEEVVSLFAKEQLVKVADQSAAPGFYIEASPAVAACLIGTCGRGLNALEKQVGKKILIRGVLERSPEDVLIRPEYDTEKLEQGISPVQVGEERELLIERPQADDERNGVARVSGFIICVLGAGNAAGRRVKGKITKVLPTYALAELLEG